jgi:hypothetical protein
MIEWQSTPSRYSGATVSISQKRPSTQAGISGVKPAKNRLVQFRQYSRKYGLVPLTAT